MFMASGETKIFLPSVWTPAVSLRLSQGSGSQQGQTALTGCSCSCKQQPDVGRPSLLLTSMTATFLWREERLQSRWSARPGPDQQSTNGERLLTVWLAVWWKRWRRLEIFHAWRCLYSCYRPQDITLSRTVRRQVIRLLKCDLIRQQLETWRLFLSVHLLFSLPS